MNPSTQGILEQNLHRLKSRCSLPYLKCIQLYQSDSNTPTGSSEENCLLTETFVCTLDYNMMLKVIENLIHVCSHCSLSYQESVQLVISYFN